MLPPETVPTSNPPQPTATATPNNHPDKRRRVDAARAATNASGAPSAASGAAASAGSHDGLMTLVDAIRNVRTRLGWSELALELFFREFTDEDKDLQLKIAEKVLTDDNKAMVFMKMPVALRKHWVKRLREVHLRSNV